MAAALTHTKPGCMGGRVRGYPPWVPGYREGSSAASPGLPQGRGALSAVTRLLPPHCQAFAPWTAAGGNRGEGCAPRPSLVH